MHGERVGTGASPAVADSRLGWLFDPKLVGLAVVCVVVVVLGGIVQVSHGPFRMSYGEVWRALTDGRVLFDVEVWQAFLLGHEVPEMSRQNLVVWYMRLPRVLVGIVVGANLAISGAIFQAVTRNELASPFILGVSSGAGAAILLTLVFLGGLAMYLPLIAAAGGAGAFLLVYLIAWKNGTSPVRLVLAGVIVGTVFLSLQQAMFFFTQDIAVAKSARAWTVGSLISTDWEQVRMVLPWSVLAVALALAGSRQLNVLLLGERTAKSLGMNVERVRFGLSGVAVLAAAASIAVAGVVSFVGLIVPHMVRNIVGSDYKKLVVGCLFAGPALVVAADVGARLFVPVVAGDTAQLPVGIVTGLLGGPYFLYLMRKQEAMGQI
ncbi:FecCD family ABC transporter permease [Haloarchaeobius litoreus]|uniref:Cobalamin import system permease protein BtuC n=1 Tax=Haloarchaeobius litoreus TaxID=755306 RepID=A0ABD6DEJ0_9EURY|nr:iron ABC transporter permease [Haloarchaeobius litoreus]